VTGYVSAGIAGRIAPLSIQLEPTVSDAQNSRFALREDHNVDARDFWQELDHDVGYSFGLHRAWKRSRSDLIVARAELLNTRLSHLDQGRGQAPWYVMERRWLNATRTRGNCRAW
jgi:hypothetical protein